MGSHRKLPLVVLLGLIPLLAAASEPATQPALVTRGVAEAPGKSSLSEYLRFVDHGTTGSRLETADVVFVNDTGVVVRLVSAVHIGEASYFKGLSDSFAERDAVLYEMVKPRDVAVPVPQEAQSAVSQLQRFLKDTLNLEFQLDRIDYSQPNFIHADLDAETFTKMQEQRGESFATLMLQQMMRAMSQPPEAQLPADPDKVLEEMIKMFTRPDMERQIKFFIAKQIGQMEEHALGLDGPGGSVILTERNKAAIQVLQNVLKDGKKNIAIFYGAAHMPDLAERLAAMGFKPVATEWRMAWDLTIRPDEPSAIEDLLMDLIRGAAETEDEDRYTASDRLDQPPDAAKLRGEMIQLSPDESRVLGVLIEKALTTPEQYPLSLNAVVHGSNQKNNRDPVTSITEDQAYEALESLRGKGFVVRVDIAGNRVPKFRHEAGQVLHARTGEVAILAELLLRGPQTLGELRGRAARMHPMESLEVARDLLRGLMDRTEPLVRQLEPVPGTRAERYAQLLCAELHPIDEAPARSQPAEDRGDRLTALESRVDQLQAQIKKLADALGHDLSASA